MKLPVTCGECDAFDPWNDGECFLSPDIFPDRTDTPPKNCPKRRELAAANRLAALEAVAVAAEEYASIGFGHSEQLDEALRRLRECEKE